HQQGIKR
ncbi:hypothetical protein MKD33_09705, partial [Chromobacterium piscinae]